MDTSREKSSKITEIIKIWDKQPKYMNGKFPQPTSQGQEIKTGKENNYYTRIADKPDYLQEKANRIDKNGQPGNINPRLLQFL
ncbi:MAG: hypothetical protein KFF73_07425 [Cyclobacteriaceae bacterium]|nr:hypothetical protein [Cyclobacteriaceae bacterium]